MAASPSTPPAAAAALLGAIAEATGVVHPAVRSVVHPAPALLPRRGELPDRSCVAGRAQQLAVAVRRVGVPVRNQSAREKEGTPRPRAVARQLCIHLSNVLQQLLAVQLVASALWGRDDLAATSRSGPEARAGSVMTMLPRCSHARKATFVYSLMETPSHILSVCYIWSACLHSISSQADQSPQDPAVAFYKPRHIHWSPSYRNAGSLEERLAWAARGHRPAVRSHDGHRRGRAVYPWRPQCSRHERRSAGGLPIIAPPATPAAKRCPARACAKDCA